MLHPGTIEHRNPVSGNGGRVAFVAGNRFVRQRAAADVIRVATGADGRTVGGQTIVAIVAIDQAFISRCHGIPNFWLPTEDTFPVGVAVNRTGRTCRISNGAGTSRTSPPGNILDAVGMIDRVGDHVIDAGGRIMAITAGKDEPTEPCTVVIDVRLMTVQRHRRGGGRNPTMTANTTGRQTASPVDGLAIMAIDVRTFLSRAVPAHGVRQAVTGNVPETIGVTVTAIGQQCSIVRSRGRMAGVARHIGTAGTGQVLAVVAGPGDRRAGIAVFVMAIATA